MLLISCYASECLSDTEYNGSEFLSCRLHPNWVIYYCRADVAISGLPWQVFLSFRSPTNPKIHSTSHALPQIIAFNLIRWCEQFGSRRAFPIPWGLFSIMNVPFASKHIFWRTESKKRSSNWHSQGTRNNRRLFHRRQSTTKRLSLVGKVELLATDTRCRSKFSKTKEDKQFDWPVIEADSDGRTVYCLRNWNWAERCSLWSWLWGESNVLVFVLSWHV